MMVATRLFTAEHLEAFTENEEKLYEVIDGVLVRNEGVGGRHGNMSVEVGSEIHSFTRPRRLGRVFGADTRFILRRDPDLVLIPDVAFIRAERIPPDGLWERIIPIPPDFALEIASPTDTMSAVRRKAALYLDHGVRLVWIVLPRQRTVSVLLPGQPERVLHERDELDGGDVIPGFRLPVASIFAD
jgi:Uma2 family endonuclease